MLDSIKHCYLIIISPNKVSFQLKGGGRRLFDRAAYYYILHLPMGAYSGRGGYFALGGYLIIYGIKHLNGRASFFSIHELVYLLH